MSGFLPISQLFRGIFTLSAVIQTFAQNEKAERGKEKKQIKWATFKKLQGFKNIFVVYKTQDKQGSCPTPVTKANILHCKS